MSKTLLERLLDFYHIDYGQYLLLNKKTSLETFSDGHSFDHIDEAVNLVKEVIAKPQHKAPKLKINPNVKNFYDFKLEDFELEDYEYEPLDKKIPVAI